MSEDADKVSEAVFRLRHGFEAAQITPAVIELATSEDWARFRFIMSDKLLMMNRYVGPDAKVWNQAEFYGVIIRGPTERCAVPGGYEYR